jgi:hypothetical protein
VAISSLFLDNRARLSSVDDIGLPLRQSASLFFGINSSRKSAKCTLMTVLDSRAVVPTLTDFNFHFFSAFCYLFLFSLFVFLFIEFVLFSVLENQKLESCTQPCEQGCRDLGTTDGDSTKGGGGEGLG